MKIEIIIEKDGDKWSAYCPNIKGVSTWGNSKNEAIKNIFEVILMILEDEKTYFTL